LAILIEKITVSEKNDGAGSLRPRGPKAIPCDTWPFRMSFYALTLATLLSHTAATATWAQTNPSVEYQVKAAFLFNFARFIEWPPQAFLNEKTPITLCVFGSDPFGGALDEIIRGKTINKREVVARRTIELSELKTCQLVFVSSSEDKSLSEILNSLKGVSALVVGESEGFAEAGGGVQFFLEDNKLRFAVNIEALQRSKLTVSSKLLALARIVQDQNRPKGR
jgi:hypothetical protein